MICSFNVHISSGGFGLEFRLRRSLAISLAGSILELQSLFSMHHCTHCLKVSTRECCSTSNIDSPPSGIRTRTFILAVFTKNRPRTGQVTWRRRPRSRQGARFMFCFVTVTVTVDVLVARVRVRPNYMPTENLKTGIQVGLGKEVTVFKPS